mmetsp:Transcript_6589/g.15973  ORF Transcript_6589/g.15973 Transcript_6589/m.15973 type:complete len:217 (-) Transcript_6589:967-1617(-)
MTATITGNTYSKPPVNSSMMTTTLTVILVTPPSTAAAPTMAYTPGVTHLDTLAHAPKTPVSPWLLCTVSIHSPAARPSSAPTARLGTSVPPGTLAVAVRDVRASLMREAQHIAATASFESSPGAGHNTRLSGPWSKLQSEKSAAIRPLVPPLSKGICQWMALVMRHIVIISDTGWWLREEVLRREEKKRMRRMTRLPKMPPSAPITAKVGISNHFH